MRQEDPRRLGPTLGWAAQMAKCAMDARVSRYDVTPVQAHVLMYLHQHGGQAPQRELTEFLRAKPSTVNGVLDRMEEKGLVRRSVIGEDARRRLITNCRPMRRPWSGDFPPRSGRRCWSCWSESLRI